MNDKSKTDILLEKIDSLEKLKENFDSYGTKPLDNKVLDETRNCVDYLRKNIGFIPGYVLPMSDGSIQLESHSDGKDIEIVIGSKGSNYSVLFEDSIEYNDLTLERLTEEVW